MAARADVRLVRAVGTRPHPCHGVAARKGIVIFIDLVVAARDCARANEVEGEKPVNDYAWVEQRKPSKTRGVSRYDEITKLTGPCNDPFTWSTRIFPNIAQSAVD